MCCIFSGPVFSFFVLLGPCGLQLTHDSKYCVMFPVVVSQGLGGVREFRRELRILNALTNVLLLLIFLCHLGGGGRGAHPLHPPLRSTRGYLSTKLRWLLLR